MVVSLVENILTNSQIALVGILLCVIEAFHAYAHTNVLLRWRPPTLEQLKRRRYYFVFDMLTPLLSYLLHESWGPLIFVHAVAHLYYVLAWNSGYYAVRIRDWSVREYRGPRLTVDFPLTCYDVGVHCLSALSLSRMFIVPFLL